MTIERNRQIQEDWLKGFSNAELQSKYGLSRQTIHNITRGVVDQPRAKRRNTQLPFHERKVISTLHARIGDEIRNYRSAKLNMNRVAFAERLGISHIKLTEIETRIADMPLSLLERIAKELGRTVSDLIEKRRIDA